MTLHSRPATRDDASAIARIYNQGIEEKSATFESEPRTAADIEGWFESGFPLVVVEEFSATIAFAASFSWRTRRWYRGIAELAIYVDRSRRGRGAGRLALEGLCREAESFGLWKLLAGVLEGNQPSVALLHAGGFRPVGAYEKQARLEGKWRDVLLFERLFSANQLPRVLFACVHNAGRSQMAAAFFNAEAKAAKAFSAGTDPGDRVHPQVVSAMSEAGIDLNGAHGLDSFRPRPRKLSAELAESAILLVTMGCGDACPVVPGVRREDWPVEDTQGKSLERVRAIRDEIRARVHALIEAMGY